MTIMSSTQPYLCGVVLHNQPYLGRKNDDNDNKYTMDIKNISTMDETTYIYNDCVSVILDL